MLLSLGASMMSRYCGGGAVALRTMNASFGTHLAPPWPYITFTPFLCRDARCGTLMFASARIALFFSFRILGMSAGLLLIVQNRCGPVPGRGGGICHATIGRDAYPNRVSKPVLTVSNGQGLAEIPAVRLPPSASYIHWL